MRSIIRETNRPIFKCPYGPCTGLLARGASQVPVRFSEGSEGPLNAARGIPGAVPACPFDAWSPNRLPNARNRGLSDAFSALGTPLAGLSAAAARIGSANPPSCLAQSSRIHISGISSRRALIRRNSTLPDAASIYQADFGSVARNQCIASPRGARCDLRSDDRHCARRTPTRGGSAPLVPRFA